MEINHMSVYEGPTDIDLPDLSQYIDRCELMIVRYRLITEDAPADRLTRIRRHIEQIKLPRNQFYIAVFSHHTSK